MQSLTHTVHMVADNTDVFSGTIMEEVPNWAKTARLQIGSADYDTLFDATLGLEEVARSSAVHVWGAVNLLEMEWTKPHCVSRIDRAAKDWRPRVNVNVVTATEVIAVLTYQDR